MLAVSEDQAIFFPKATCLPLLNKLDDDLGKRIMVEPFFDAIPEVALRSVNIDKFTLATQSISHQVGMSQLIFHDIVNSTSKSYPRACLGVSFF